MDKERTVAVLDVGTRKVCCLIARLLPPPQWLAAKAENAQINVLGFCQHASAGMAAGQICDMDTAEESIRAAVAKAEQNAGLTVDEIHVGFSGGRLQSESFTASVPIAHRSVDDIDIRRALLAARQYAGRAGQSVLHTLVTHYGLDDVPHVSDPRGMIGDTLKVGVLATTVDHMPLKNMALCVERCHLRLAGVIGTPYASALAVITDAEAELGATCIDMGAGTTTLAAFYDGQVIHLDSLSVGGDHITRDLARNLSTPRSEAERLKTLYASVFADPVDETETVVCPLVGEGSEDRYIYPTKGDLAEIVRTRLEDIFFQLRERMEQAGIESSVSERLILTGGGSQLVGCTELAARIFGGEARLGRPEGISGLPPNADPAFAASVGMLKYLLGGSEDYEPLEGPRTRLEPPHLGHEPGYLARVGQWLRENF